MLTQTRRIGAAAMLAGALVAASSLAGCKRLEQAKKAAELVASAAAAGTASPVEDKDQAASNKLGPYIACLNDVSPRAFDSRNRYLQWVKDKNVGPTGKERNVYGLYKITAESCLKGLDENKAKQPALPEIDAAAASYRSALEALVPLVKDAEAYYEQDDYKDDKMAKGKEMHGPLMAAFDKFEAAHKPFDDKVTALNDEIGSRRLVALGKDPARRFQFLVESTLTDAKHLVRVADVRTLDALDADRFSAKLEVFNKTLSELDQYAEAHKAETDKVMMFSSFLSEAKTYQKAAKELMRRKRDKKDFNKEFFSGSSPQMVEGHPVQVLEKYNSMVGRSNNLQFRR